MMGQQQQGSRRGSTRKQDEGKFGRQNQFADGALPLLLLLANSSTRKQDNG